MAKRIAVIGGGMAGLAAAMTLASNGEQVTLFEANQTLGGRARGIKYQNQTLDNGQHILLGAYHETLRLMSLAGVDIASAFRRLPLDLTILDLLGQHNFKLATNPKLPAPFHLLLGLLSAKGITLSDKFHAIELLSWMKWCGFRLKDDEPLLTLLTRKNQSKVLIQQLWEPLCLSALNTPIELASAQVFLNVLRDSFSKKKHDADVLLPAHDLTSLISEPMAHYITHHGGEVRCSINIQNITHSSEGYILTHNTHSEHFSHVIIACGPHQLKNLTALLPQISSIADYYHYRPITTVYLQFSPQTRLPKAMIGSINSLTQWIFDRGQICGQAGLIAVVISAHSPFTDSQANLTEKITVELQQLFPQLGQPLWHKVITEKRATFSCDVMLKRPSNQTAYHHLLIAGDYTAGDYPATIEGAIRSGIQAANLV